MSAKQKKTSVNGEMKVITGNHAAAYACKSANVEVVAAYPITPQSPVVEKISSFVENREMEKTQFITVESEQTAITAVISASATGARVFTASSANGLMYMYELLCWAAGNRLPIVMCIPTRAVGAPWNVNTDNQDAFSIRDTGFLQMYCEDNQEIYDSVLIAYRVAEDSRVYLPCSVNYDGYILSHTLMPVIIESDEKVAKFLPELKHHINLFDVANPKGVSPVTTPNPIARIGEPTAPGYMEFRFAMQKAAENSIEVFEQAHQEFAKIFGRSYGNGIYKAYKAEDAEILIFALGAVACEARNAVDLLRAEGMKIGIISLKLFRPFPVIHLQQAFSKCQTVVVFDRDVGYGYEGILCYELKAALYGQTNAPYIKGYILGLGGRDITIDQLLFGVKKAVKQASTKEVDYRTEFLGLRLEELGFKAPNLKEM
jgi:pyruvate/2-oxoacid:ferredoxin oxidoreductase alpha subunit